MSPHPKLPPEPQKPLWEILSRQAVYDASPWIRVERQRIRLPDGRVIDDYHQLLLPDYAIVFAETDDGRVIMQRQYKHGVGGVTLTLPGGLLRPGEDALLGAQRELLEETGYEAPDWRSLGQFVQNSNYGGSRGHLFAARAARWVVAPDAGDLEEIEVVMMSRAEVVAALGRNEIQVSSFAAAIAMATHPAFGG